MTLQRIKTFTEANIRAIFYLAWFSLSLLQAMYTELLHDEAYYWIYASRPDWGYFDHPPLIAWLIRIGYSLIPGELGVRLLAVLLNTAAIILLERLVKPTNLKLFFALVASVAILHLGGIFATPDAPLLFFSVLFYTVFNQYLQRASYANGLLLALVMAALLYTKYHGVLILLISLLSNRFFVRKKSFWLALFTLFLLMLPHIYWQYTHDFPSIKYHFLERDSAPFDLWLVINYACSIPFVFGPFAGFWLIYALFIYRPITDFEKTLRWNGLITLLFFLLLSLKGRIEANWTLIAFVPLIYSGYKAAENQLKISKLLIRLLPLSLITILGLRLYLMWDFLPSHWQIKPEFHNNKVWAQQIKNLAGSQTVAFMNSYQLASKYAFYSGDSSFSLNNASGRRNQFTLWDSEYNHQGDNVLLIANYPADDFKILSTAKGKVLFTNINNFRSYGNTRILTPVKKIEVFQNEIIHVPVKIETVNNNQRNTTTNPAFTAHLSYAVFRGNINVAEHIVGQPITNAMFNDDVTYNITLQFNLPPGEYKLRLGVKAAWLPTQAQGESIQLIIKEK